MILHIFDLKQMCYIAQGKKNEVTAGYVEDNNRYRPRKFKCGALAYIIDEVIPYMSDNESLICFCVDTKPTYKYELAQTKLRTTYKANRKEIPLHVKYQYAFAKKMIQALGFNYIELDGYEADDGISSLVHKYKSAFKKIYIHTNDSDAYYLVCDKVEILPASTRGRAVTMANYQEMTKQTQYNILTLKKLLNGEDTDTIQPIIHKHGVTLMETLPKEIYKYCGNNELLRVALRNACDDCEDTMATFDMIAPVLITDERVVLDMRPRINMQLLYYFGVMFSSYRCRGYSFIKNEVGESMIDRFVGELEDKEVI